MVFIVSSGRWISREWGFQHSCWIPKAERTARYAAGFGWSLTKKSYPAGAFLPLSRVAHCVLSGLHISLHNPCIQSYFLEREFYYAPQADPKPQFLLPQPPLCWDHRQYHHTHVCVANLIPNTTTSGGAAHNKVVTAQGNPWLSWEQMKATLPPTARWDVAARIPSSGADSLAFPLHSFPSCEKQTSFHKYPVVT